MINIKFFSTDFQLNLKNSLFYAIFGTIFGRVGVYWAVFLETEAHCIINNSIVNLND